MGYMEQQMQTSIEAGISNADQCYARIAELEEQNVALVAQNGMLRSALMDQLNDCINFDGGNLTTVIMENSSNILKSTPQQCLREVQVEAGRAGFVAGAHSMKLAFMYGGTYRTEDKANQYAEEIRKGEVK